MLMDFDIHAVPSQGIDYYKDIVSLSLTGTHNTIRLILDLLGSPLLVQCLSLPVPGYEEEFEHILSDDLFGERRTSAARISLQISRIVMPHLLFHGVTHFASREPISPSGLLNMLHQVTTLTYLEFYPLPYLWDEIDVDKLHLSPIHTRHN